MAEIVGRISGYGDIDAEVRRMRAFIMDAGCTPTSQPWFHNNGKEIPIHIEYKCRDANRELLVKLGFE